MTRKCSIIGCRSNYVGRKGDSQQQKVTVFRFPIKDKDRLAEWLRRIPQQLEISGITENMGICEKHFDPRFILREYSAKRSDGLLVPVPRPFPILADDAIPTVFENTPSYCTVKLPSKRKHPDDRRADMTARDDAVLQQFLDEGAIKDYDDFKVHVSSKTAELSTQWNIVIRENCIAFIYIDVTSCPVIVCSFQVFVDLSVVAFNRQEPVNLELFKFLLGSDCKLSLWSQTCVLI